MTTPTRTVQNAVLSMHPIGTALTDAAARLAYIRELLPVRGELVEEFRELVTTLAWIEKTYRDADEALTAAAFALQHAEDVPAPLPLAEHAVPIDTIRATRSGAQTPGNANPTGPGDPMALTILHRATPRVSTP